MLTINPRRCMPTCLLITITIVVFSFTNKPQPILFPFSSTSSSNCLSTKWNYDNTTTIVIGYFPLKKSKHTKARYLAWLENLLGYCQAPMVIFTSIEYQPILHRLRRNGSLASFFIVDYSTPLEMPPIQSLVPVFEQQHLIDPERGYHSVELYAVWCAKSFMLNRSAELNPFRTKYFLYVDAGAFRSPNYRFQWWPSGQIIRTIFNNDRLLLSMIDRLPRRFCPLNYNMTQGPIKINLIQGGVIGGSASAIHWWTSLFYETINTYASNNFFIGKDQYLMNAIGLVHADRLNMMLSFRVFCGDTWFTFGPLLANESEKQMLSYSLSCQQQSFSPFIIPFENVCNDEKNLM